MTFKQYTLYFANQILLFNHKPIEIKILWVYSATNIIKLPSSQSHQHNIVTKLTVSYLCCKIFNGYNDSEFRIYFDRFQISGCLQRQCQNSLELKLPISWRHQFKCSGLTSNFEQLTDTSSMIWNCLGHVEILKLYPLQIESIFVPFKLHEKIYDQTWITIRNLRINPIYTGLRNPYSHIRMTMS